MDSFFSPMRLLSVVQESVKNLESSIDNAMGLGDGEEGSVDVVGDVSPAIGGVVVSGGVSESTPSSTPLKLSTLVDGKGPAEADQWQTTAPAPPRKTPALSATKVVVPKAASKVLVASTLPTMTTTTKTTISSAGAAAEPIIGAAPAAIARETNAEVASPSQTPSSSSSLKPVLSPADNTTTTIAPALSVPEVINSLNTSPLTAVDGWGADVDEDAAIDANAAAAPQPELEPEKHASDASPHSSATFSPTASEATLTPVVAVAVTTRPSAADKLLQLHRGDTESLSPHSSATFSPSVLEMGTPAATGVKHAYFLHAHSGNGGAPTHSFTDHNHNKASLHPSPPPSHMDVGGGGGVTTHTLPAVATARH